MKTEYTKISAASGSALRGVVPGSKAGLRRRDAVTSPESAWLHCLYAACISAERSPRPDHLLHLQFRNQGGRLALFKFYFFVYLVVLRSSLLSGPFSSDERGLLSKLVTSLVADHGLCVHGLQQLWCRGLVVSRHVGSSRIRDQNHVSFIGR